MDDLVREAPFLMKFVAAPGKRWANPAKRLHDTEQTGDDTLRSASQMRAARPTTFSMATGVGRFFGVIWL
jgi:hypothetical protein